MLNLSYAKVTVIFINKDKLKEMHIHFSWCKIVFDELLNTNGLIFESLVFFNLEISELNFCNLLLKDVYFENVEG